MVPGYMASEAANLGQLRGATYRVHLNAGVFFGGGHGKTSALRMILRIRGTNKRQWQPLKPCMFESYREEQKKDKKVSRVDSLVHPYACMYHHVFSVVFQAHDAFYLLWPQSEGWQSGKNYTSMDPK